MGKPHEQIDIMRKRDVVKEENANEPLRTQY